MLTCTGLDIRSFATMLDIAPARPTVLLFSSFTQTAHSASTPQYQFLGSSSTAISIKGMTAPVSKPWT